MGKTTRRINRSKPSQTPSSLNVGENVALAESELKTLREMQQRLIQLKVTLADVALQEDQLARGKSEVAAAIEKQQATMREQARSVVRAHGFDPDSQDKSWTVKIDEGVIVRVA